MFEMCEHTQKNSAPACGPRAGPNPIYDGCPGCKSQEGRASGRVSLSGPSLLWTLTRELFEGGSKLHKSLCRDEENFLPFWRADTSLFLGLRWSALPKHAHQLLFIIYKVVHICNILCKYFQQIIYPLRAHDYLWSHELSWPRVGIQKPFWTQTCVCVRARVRVCTTTSLHVLGKYLNLFHLWYIKSWPLGPRHRIAKAPCRYQIKQIWSCQERLGGLRLFPDYISSTPITNEGQRTTSHFSALVSPSVEKKSYWVSKYLRHLRVLCTSNTSLTHNSIS